MKKILLAFLVLGFTLSSSFASDCKLKLKGITNPLGYAITSKTIEADSLGECVESGKDYLGKIIAANFNRYDPDTHFPEQVSKTIKISRVNFSFGEGENKIEGTLKH